MLDVLAGLSCRSTSISLHLSPSIPLCARLLSRVWGLPLLSFYTASVVGFYFIFWECIQKSAISIINNNDSNSSCFLQEILGCYTQPFCSMSSNLFFWSTRCDGMGMMGMMSWELEDSWREITIIHSSMHRSGFSVVHDYRHRIPSTLLSSCVFGL